MSSEIKAGDKILVVHGIRKESLSSPYMKAEYVTENIVLFSLDDTLVQWMMYKDGDEWIVKGHGITVGKFSIEQNAKDAAVGALAYFYNLQGQNRSILETIEQEKQSMKERETKGIGITYYGVFKNHVLVSLFDGEWYLAGKLKKREKKPIELKNGMYTRIIPRYDITDIQVVQCDKKEGVCYFHAGSKIEYTMKQVLKAEACVVKKGSEKK